MVDRWKCGVAKRTHRRCRSVGTRSCQRSHTQQEFEEGNIVIQSSQFSNHSAARQLTQLSLVLHSAEVAVSSIAEAGHDVLVLVQLQIHFRSDDVHPEQRHRQRVRSCRQRWQRA